MFLNKVVVGNGYKVTHDQPSYKAPPAGYDSVKCSSFLFAGVISKLWGDSALPFRFWEKLVEI